MRQLILVLVLATPLLPGCVQELPPMVGGYSDATRSREVRKAAEFAVRQQSAKSGERLTLAGITQAQQQVVAGMNYRMTLKVKSGKEIRLAEAVVYQSLAPQQMLASWRWVDEVGGN